MATAIIKSTISASTIVGSRDDGAVGTLVSLAHDGTATTYFWEFVNVPPLSAAILSSASSATPTFTPDMVGSYLIKLTIDGDNAGADTRVVAVKTDVLGIRIPAGGETNEYDNNPSGIDGWHESLYDAFQSIDDIAGKIIKTDGTSVPTADISWGTKKITNLGAPSVSTDAARLGDIPTTLSGLSTFSLSQLNARLTDATLDNSSATRTPSAHSLSSSYHTAISLAQLNALITDATLDNSSATRTPSAHGLGSASHSSTTLSGLNALISDADLDSSTDQRDPFAHELAGGKHTSSTLADLNSKIIDARIASHDMLDAYVTLANWPGTQYLLDSYATLANWPGAQTLLDDYATTVSLESKADKTLLDSYAKLSNWPGTQALLDGYAPASGGGYAEKVLLDSYSTIINWPGSQILLDSYAELSNWPGTQDLLDGYVSLSDDYDGYASVPSGIVVQSPDGTHWTISVDDSGSIIVNSV